MEPLDLSDEDEGRSTVALALVFTSLKKYNATTMNSLGSQPVPCNSETNHDVRSRTIMVNEGRSALWLLSDSLPTLTSLGLNRSKYSRPLVSSDGGGGRQGRVAFVEDRFQVVYPIYPLSCLDW